MRAMVLGAGLGTRLRPLTDEIPKPAIPIANVPLAVIAVRRLAQVGVTDVVVNAHHLPEVLEAALRELPVAGVHVEVVREPVLLGTGGGVRAALEAQSTRLGAPANDEPILLVNGDVLFDPDLAAALSHHRAMGALATMVLRADPRADVLGPIDVDGTGRVRRILRGPGEPDPSFRTMMFTGVHVLSGRAIAALPVEGCIIRRGYVPALGRGDVIAGVVETATFRDCGTPTELLGAMADVLGGRAVVPGVAIPASGSLVASGATVAGAWLEGSCVGAGARLAPGITLRRCLVLPGAEVRESVEDAILSQRHRLPP